MFEKGGILKEKKISKMKNYANNVKFKKNFEIELMNKNGIFRKFYAIFCRFLIANTFSYFIT